MAFQDFNPERRSKSCSGLPVNVKLSYTVKINVCLDDSVTDISGMSPVTFMFLDSCQITTIGHIIACQGDVKMHRFMLVTPIHVCSVLEALMSTVFALLLGAH